MSRSRIELVELDRQLDGAGKHQDLGRPFSQHAPSASAGACCHLSTNLIEGLGYDFVPLFANRFAA